MDKEKLSLPVVGESEATALLKVGELAKRSGKTARALHLYEEMGF